MAAAWREIGVPEGLEGRRLSLPKNSGKIWEMGWLKGGMKKTFQSFGGFKFSFKCLGVVPGLGPLPFSWSSVRGGRWVKMSGR